MGGVVPLYKPTGLYSGIGRGEGLFPNVSLMNKGGGVNVSHFNPMARDYIWEWAVLGNFFLGGDLIGIFTVIIIQKMLDFGTEDFHFLSCSFTSA